MAAVPNYCDLCGNYESVRGMSRFTLDLPDLDLIHTAHTDTVDLGDGTVDICYDCIPSVSQWLSRHCSLCGDRVDHVFRFKSADRPDFQFITCMDCSGWERREQ